MKKFGLNDNNLKVFTYAGTHAPYQGLETIIYAADFLKTNSNIIILMAGKGPESDKLKALSSSLRLKNLFFINSPFDEMKELMSITYASIVVLKDKPTARKQRLSKVIPPLACGVPVIFAGYGESADMLKENNCGMTLEPDNPEKLSQSMLKLCNNEDLRNELGENGLSYVQKELSWEVIIDKWLSEIQN